MHFFVLLLILLDIQFLNWKKMQVFIPRKLPFSAMAVVAFAYLELYSFILILYPSICLMRFFDYWTLCWNSGSITVVKLSSTSRYLTPLEDPIWITIVNKLNQTLIQLEMIYYFSQLQQSTVHLFLFNSYFFCGKRN